MKKIYLIAFLLISQSLFSQYASTGIGRWKLGVNIGGSFQTADISTKLFGIGFGATLEYALIENNHSFFGFSFRDRYLNARTYGNHYQLNSDPISNNNINGVVDSSFNYSNLPLYQNNKTTLNEYSIEAMLKWNRLYQKTGLLFYIYAGGGFTHYKVKTNQLDNSGNLYDYSSIISSADKSSIQNELDALRDNDYETSFSNPNFKSTVFTPTIGIGFGYRIAPFFDIAFEHKMSLPQTQLFDGQLHETNDPPFIQDIYHYSSIGFIFHINHQNNGSAYTPYEEDPYIAPVATATTPTQSSTSTPTTTTTPSSSTTTTTTPVSSPNNNGNTSAPNTTIYPPQITITNPSGSNFTSPNCTIKIEADILRVNTQNDITFYHEGNKIPNYKFFYSNGKFNATVSLNEGVNKFKIIAVNGNLSDTKEFSYSCNNLTQISICHNNPTTNKKENITIYEKDWKTHAEHGDTKGNCPVTTTIPNDPLINICHHFNGTKSNLVIKQSEWMLHQSHGDIKGNCPPISNTTIPPKEITPPNDPLINICHHFNGTKSNLVIKQSEWVLHQSHGDTKGNCPPISTTTTPPKEITPPNDPLINICHHFNGTKSNLVIKKSEWTLHQAHGDTKGICPPISTTVTSPKEITPPNDPLINICHHFNGTKSNLVIKKSEWSLHQAHGDTKGACKLDDSDFNNGSPNEDITICHILPNNNTQTLQINPNDWPIHQAHGDSKQPCDKGNTNAGLGNSGGNTPKITICHIPPGNNSNPQTIQISPSAWPAHQAHGDTQGACSNGNKKNESKVKDFLDKVIETTKNSTTTKPKSTPPKNTKPKPKSTPPRSSKPKPKTAISKKSEPKPSNVTPISKTTKKGKN